MASILHPLQVSDITGGDVTHSVAVMVLNIVVGLGSMLLVIVVVVNVLDVMVGGVHRSGM